MRKIFSSVQLPIRNKISFGEPAGFQMSLQQQMNYLCQTEYSSGQLNDRTLVLINKVGNLNPGKDNFLSIRENCSTLASVNKEL